GRRAERGDLDANRVPPAGAADVPPRRSGAPPRSRPGRLAARRDRAREHPGYIRCETSAQATGARTRSRHRDRPRRRIQDRMRRLGIRGRLQLAVGVAVAAALIGLVAGFNLILANVLDRDARDLVRARAVAEVDSLRTTGGRLSVGEAPDDRAADAYVWIFEGARLVEQPRAAPTIEGAARTLAGSSRRFLDVPSTDTRLYAAPVVVHGRRVGTVVAGVSLAPYEQTRKLALLGSLVLGGLVLLIV